MIDAINTVLTPFIATSYTSEKGKEERENHLALILSKAARLGRMLFSQPVTWRFTWEIPTKLPEKSSQKQRWATEHTRGVVVYPAIWKTGDIDGRELPSAILKRPPEVDNSLQPVSTAKTFIKKTIHASGKPLWQKDAVLQAEEGRRNMAHVERLYIKGEPNSTMGNATDAVRTSNYLPSSKRDLNDSEQDDDVKFAATDTQSPHEQRNENPIAERRESSDEKAIVSIHNHVNNRYSRENQPHLERRQTAEAVAPNSKQQQISQKPLPALAIEESSQYELDSTRNSPRSSDQTDKETGAPPRPEDTVKTTELKSKLISSPPAGSPERTIRDSTDENAESEGFSPPGMRSDRVAPSYLHNDRKEAEETEHELAKGRMPLFVHKNFGRHKGAVVRKRRRLPSATGRTIRDLFN